MADPSDVPIVLSGCDLDRFRDKVDVQGVTECWPWVAGTFRRGYGRFHLKGRSVKAHRVAWTLANGMQVPAQMLVLHHCDNPRCCNPEHLTVGTTETNVRHRQERARTATGVWNGNYGGRHSRRGEDHWRWGGGKGALGEDSPNSKLTEGQVKEIRRLYATGMFRQVDLAARFCVSQHLISRVVRRKNWKHVA